MKRSIQKKVVMLMAGLLATIVIMQSGSYFLFFHSTKIMRQDEKTIHLSDVFQARLTEHIIWACRLKESILLNKKFNGQADYRKCKFGKWLKDFSEKPGYMLLSPLQQKQMSETFQLHKSVHASLPKINRTKNHLEKQRIFKSEVENKLSRIQSLQKSIITELKSQRKIYNDKLDILLEINKYLILALMIAAFTIAGILCISVSRKLENFIQDILQVMSKIARNEPFDNIRNKTICCSDIRKCGKKNCPMYGKKIDDCFLEVGSYAPMVNQKIVCPAITSGLYKDCGECEVMKKLAPDELSFATIMFLHILEQREMVKTSFGKFVDKQLAEQSMHKTIELGGQLQEVTVLFIDIRSFTTIAEHLTPKETVSFLNEYMDMMLKCIDKSGGSVNKFIGDAVMAVWGGAFSKNNDPGEAVTAALKMREKLVEFNAQSAIEGHPKIATGCGICTGTVLAGQIGSDLRMEYTVIGDTVNTAARLEKLNKSFGTTILISENTYEHVKDDFEITPMGDITVEGKKISQKVYSVTGKKKS